MVNLNRLKGIRELTPGEWGEDGAKLDVYTEKLTAFTDKFPEKEEALRDALADGDTAALVQCTADIRDLLFSIGADALAADCLAKSAEFPSMSAGSLEACVEGFISAVSALSIDIQMAIYGQEHAASTQQAGESGGEEREPVILAVDDNSFFLNTIKSYLQGSQYKLTCVNAGSVALRFLERHTPDLFVLDIDMPEMDGYELAAKIRERGFKAPIIFLTGNASKEYVIKAVKVGAADFIIKPISKTQALEKIAKYI